MGVGCSPGELVAVVISSVRSAVFAMEWRMSDQGHHSRECVPSGFTHGKEPALLFWFGGVAHVGVVEGAPATVVQTAVETPRLRGSHPFGVDGGIPVMMVSVGLFAEIFIGAMTPIIQLFVLHTKPLYLPAIDRARALDIGNAPNWDRIWTYDHASVTEPCPMAWKGPVADYVWAIA